MTACFCGCGRFAQDAHHVLTAQRVRRAGGDVTAVSNLIPLARTCHASHHAGSDRLWMHVVPDEAVEFAADLLGPGAALEYFRRFYWGDDPRLDGLLARLRAMADKEDGA